MNGERYRAAAPVRLDLAGGWTDVAPFAEREGGVVVNAAIELLAQAEVEPGGAGYSVQADDLDRSLELTAAELSADPGGDLALHRAALRCAALGPCRLRTRSGVPPGSGLGSSGALGVALVAATDAARGVRRPPAAQAEAAFELEALEAGLPGGRQDQYAAAHGGFHRLGFAAGSVAVQPLSLDAAFAAALRDHTVVCYTGRSRVSSNTISRVMGAYQRGERDVGDALRRMVELAERIAEALVAADLAQVGRLLSENWRQQQRLDRAMRSDEMARLEDALGGSGILGGKAAGAGAGGSMFFLARHPAEARRAACEAGCRVLEFDWATAGVRQESGA